MSSIAAAAVAVVVLSTALAADAPYPGMQPLSGQFEIAGATAVDPPEMAASAGVSFRFRAESIPVLEEAMPYVQARYTCGGAKRNTAFAASRVEIGPAVTEVQRIVVHDVQTSGGLLIAVPPERCDGLVADLRRGGDGQAGAVGEILPKGPPVVVA